MSGKKSSITGSGESPAVADTMTLSRSKSRRGKRVFITWLFDSKAVQTLSDGRTITKCSQINFIEIYMLTSMLYKKNAYSATSIGWFLFKYF